jgi:hypothetical protein
VSQIQLKRGGIAEAGGADVPNDVADAVNSMMSEIYSGVGGTGTTDAATAALALNLPASNIANNVGVIFQRPPGKNVVASQTVMEMTNGTTTYKQVYSYNADGDLLEITPWQ